MATQKTDFLKFNAYSMKELITRKMSEDSKFTDQIYEGSNLAILIDLVAYMYQVLVYQLNNAASESMFSDTQIYENISRLVKMIGYNPRGCIPATMKLNIIRETDQRQNVTLLKYSRLDTGLTDTRGETIYFSVPNVDDLGHSGSMDLESELTRTVTMVNGQWKLYPQVFVASGSEYETFVLDQLKSDSAQNKYVADGYMDVFVKRDGTFGQDFQYTLDKEELLTQTSKNSSGFEVNANRIYTSSSKVFTLKLNENKVYEIKFGDGTIGEKLKPNDQVYIMYLETNGPDGNIDIGSINFEDLKFEHSRQMLGLSLADYNAIFEINGSKNLITDGETEYTLSPYSMNTTKPMLEQSVDDIKQYAPQWFKTGNRLLTRTDYEFFVKMTIPQIIDVKCMNNWEYLASFQKWLYECGVNYHQDVSNPGRYYFTENKFTKNGFDMVDAADANNIYLWIQPPEDSTLDQVRDKLKAANIDYLKILTSELQFIEPIPVYFDICASYVDVAREYAKKSDFQSFILRAQTDSYIEITLDENCIYVNSYIYNRVQSIFAKYFQTTNLKIGQNINISDILDEIYAIGGITRVRTVFQPTIPYEYVDQDQYPPRAIDGISLVSWSGAFIDQGEDVQIGNVTRHIQDFQLPMFNGSVFNSLQSRIKIIKKQLTNISNIKY